MALADGQGTALAEENTREPIITSNILSGQSQPLWSSPMSSTPVEMTQFGQQAATDATSGNAPISTMSEPIPSSGEGPKQESLTAREDLGISATAKPSSPVTVQNALLARKETAPAIGSSSDKPIPVPKESDLAGPTLIITLLLTNGARHPYKIDERYLKKRAVNVDGNNPVNMSVYTLKELIWREWREEWEPRPSSPSSIRIIYYGKMLEDKARLHDCKFEIGNTPHVVHMTIKPQEVVDDEDAKGSKTGGRDRDGNERSTGCRCAIL